jgi:hypothetical protein
MKITYYLLLLLAIQAVFCERQNVTAYLMKKDIKVFLLKDSDESIKMLRAALDEIPFTFEKVTKLSKFLVVIKHDKFANIPPTELRQKVELL